MTADPTTIRNIVINDLTDAYSLISHELQALPHAGLPQSTDLDETLGDARNALTRATNLIVDLAQENPR